MLSCSSTAVNASIAIALDSSPASSGRQPGILATISATWVIASWSSLQISTSESIGSPRLPSSLAGRWWKAATTWHAGTAACTCAATEPRGGTSGWNSPPTRTRALAIDTTILPFIAVSCSCAVVAAESHGVAITTRSAVGRGRVVAVLETIAEVWPALDERVPGLHRPVLRARADDRLVADAGEAGGEPTTSRPGAAEDADAHGVEPCIPDLKGYGRTRWGSSTARTSWSRAC